MIAELVMAYYFATNQPVYTDNTGPDLLYSVELKVKEPLTEKLFLDVDPYMWGSKDNPSRAGLIADIGYKINDDFTIKFRHHSYHNLDYSGFGYQENSIQLEWRLW